MSKKRARSGGDIRQFFAQPQKKKRAENMHCKVEQEQSGLDMDTAHMTTKSFKFRYNKNTHTVTCDPSKTIKTALQTNDSFKDIYENNKQKEMIIARRTTPPSTVTSHFPLCLIDENEILDINLRQTDSTNPEEKTSLHPDVPAERENLVSFYISRRGGDKIRRVLQQRRLLETEYVGVYAAKGETVEAALKRDGRFIEDIFRKGILFEESSKSFINLTNMVDENLDGKSFLITLNPYQTQAQTSAEKNENHKGPETPQATNTNQDSTTAPEKNAETPQEEKKPRKYPETKEIPNTQEILNLLREQHGDLLKILKERENLKNNADVKRFFREEYDKSAQSFSEVKRVKRLMVLSDSVCQIRVDGSPIGTGFLLCGRFVLTNAHVADLVPSTLKSKVTAVFEFEDLNPKREPIHVKENLVAYWYGNDDMGNYLDFALLELNSCVQRPKLLKFYSAPPRRGGVCIIGHPAGGVKRMDPCFIIPKEDVPQEADRYFKKNQNLEVFQVITQWGLKEVNDSAFHKSQINYNTCFFHGSSGSPVFDEYCNLIGVHTGGYVYKGEGKKTRSVMEYGLPMFPILVRIFIQCSGSGSAVGSDVLKYFKSQKNMELVCKVAKEQLQRNRAM